MRGLEPESELEKTIRAARLSRRSLRGPPCPPPPNALAETPTELVEGLGPIMVWSPDVSRGAPTLDVESAGEKARLGNSDGITSMSTTTHCWRVAAEEARPFAPARVATPIRTLNVGGRRDGDDYATGAGVEVGADLALTDPTRG